MKRVSSLMLVLAIPATFACERIDSSDIRTAGVEPIIQATALGNGKTSVSAELRVGGALSNNFLDLSEGDQLNIKSDDEELVMTRNVSLLNQVYYTAELEGDNEDKAIEISFIREADESAPSSTVTMPASFTLTAPESGLALVGSTDDLAIAWDNAGKTDPLQLYIVGTCIDSHKETLEDDGAHVVPANTLTLDEDQGSNECELTVTLERTRTGSLDAAFASGGEIQATVVRKVSISFTP